MLARSAQGGARGGETVCACVCVCTCTHMRGKEKDVVTRLPVLFRVLTLISMVFSKHLVFK